MFFYRYETNCCFHCTKDEDSTAKINLCIRFRLSRSRAKTFDYNRKTMKKALKIWRNKRESNEFIFSYIIDDDDYEFFFNNEIIKEIIKNVHLMQIVENFLAISTNWSRNWLNKYVEKLIVLVMHATINAKKSNRRAITSATNNNISVEDLIIEEANAIEKSDDSAHQDSSAVFVTFITFSASEIIIEKMNRSQNSNKSRREAAIKSEIFRRNNLRHFQQWNLIKNLINYVNIFKWNELLNNHQKNYHHSVIYCYFIDHQ